MFKKWDNDILEVFLVSWLGVIIFLEMTVSRFIVGIALMLMATFLLLLTLIPRKPAPYVHKPRSILFARITALFLFIIGILIRTK